METKNWIPSSRQPLQAAELFLTFTSLSLERRVLRNPYKSLYIKVKCSLVSFGVSLACTQSYCVLWTLACACTSRKPLPVVDGRWFASCYYCGPSFLPPSLPATHPPKLLSCSTSWKVHCFCHCLKDVMLGLRGQWGNCCTALKYKHHSLFGAWQ